MIEEFEKLEINDGDVFICKTKGLGDDEYRNIIKAWNSILETKDVDALILIVPESIDLSKADEKTMNEFGWYRIEQGIDEKVRY